MSADPLYRPLGMHPPATDQARRSRKGWLPAAGLGVLASGAVAWGVHHGRTSTADRQVAIVAIESPARTAPVQPPTSINPLPEAPSAARIVTMGSAGAANAANSVEVQNGVKIIRFNPASSSSPVTIPVDAAAVPLPPAPDPRVSEKTLDGVLPRVALNGMRASAVYARPAPVSGDSFRVALVLAGMGTDQLATADAARRLPADLDFALAPDVPDGAAQVADIRRAGREVVMDLRLPAQDTAGAGTLLRRMAAWPGYIGALLAPTNVATDGPVIAARGVGVVGSGRASGIETTSVVADLVIDAAAPEAAASLDRVVAMARAKGSAVVIADHAAAGQAAIASFLSEAGRQGIAFVPLSALAEPRGGDHAAAR